VESLLNWALRALLWVLGAGAALWLVRSVAARRGSAERWPLRLALGMVLLAIVYAAGHAKLLVFRQEIEAGRMAYARFGDPRLSEQRRAEVRGWILDCTAEGGRALARYGEQGDSIVRVYPLGEAGANLLGGGKDADERDYTIERLYTDRLREPLDLGEQGALHPAGTDLRVTLCSDVTRRAWDLLRESGRPGAVVVQDVSTGALVGYAATGGPEEAPFGIKRYAPPGSVFKLALAALWWENNLPDQTPIPCPGRIAVNNRGGFVRNYEANELGTVIGPRGMLVPSCNTAAVQMAWQMRETLGSQAFVDAYRRFGFTPYTSAIPAKPEPDFWATSSKAWQARMTPPPARIRMSDSTSRAEWAQIAIGQGPVDVTPIQISRFVQAIGNDGVMLRPTLEWEKSEKPETVRRIMKPSTAEKLLGAMREVVQRGTARSARGYLQGTDWSLAGKTGTAEIPGRPDDGWFAGLALDPSGRPRYTTVVYLQGGGPGGGRPAGIAARLVGTLSRESARRTEPAKERG
jgi:cell division protein FtsI/penicillin-binding protein 2